jgi:hypothetical protein
MGFGLSLEGLTQGAVRQLERLGRLGVFGEATAGMDKTA